MTSTFKFELKRNINQTNIVVLIIFILIGIIINQVSIEKHRSEIAKQHSFLKLEKKRIEQYHNYFLIARYGFRILGISNNMNILFCDSNTFCGYLISSFNSFEKLELSKPQIGGNAFEKPTSGVLDFSWYLLTIGSMIALAFGWFSFRNKDFLKQLMASASSKPAIIHLVILTARILLLIVSLAFIIIIIGIQMLINGLLSNDVIAGLPSFFLTSILCMVFLFIIATILGTFRNIVIGISVNVFVWFCLLFMWPKIQNSILSHNTENIIKPIFNHEFLKLDILMNFEKSLYEKLSKYNTLNEKNKVTKEMGDLLLKSEFKKIEYLEFEMIRKTESFIKKFHFWSIFNPATFYKSVNNELSGRGYISYIDFYKYVQKKQRQFLEFYIKKRFYENNPKVEPFLKDDEYIFHLKSSLPAYYLQGVIYNILLIVLLYFISFLCFKRFIFPIENNEVFSDLDLKLEKGKHYVYTYNQDDHHVPEQIYNVFWGTAGKFSGKISIDNESIVTREKKNFIYLPVPDSLPGKLKVKTIINFFAGLFNLSKPENKKVKEEFKTILDKRFEKIEDVEKAHIILRMAEYKKQVDIYLLHDFFLHIDKPGILIGVLDELKKKGIIIVEINYFYHITKNPDRASIIRINDSEKYKEILVSPL